MGVITSRMRGVCGMGRLHCCSGCGCTCVFVCVSRCGSGCDSVSESRCDCVGEKGSVWVDCCRKVCACVSRGSVCGCGCEVFV